MARTTDLRYGSSISADHPISKPSGSLRHLSTHSSNDEKSKASQHSSRRTSFYEDLHPGTPNFPERLIHKHGSDPRHNVTLQLSMDLDIEQIFAKELDSSDDLADVVILVGGSESAAGGSGSWWATTIGDYVQHTWPESAVSIMFVLGLIQQGSHTEGGATHQVSGCHGDLLIHLSTTLNNMILEMQGPIGSQTDLVEAIACLSLVLQLDRQSHMPSTYFVRLCEQGIITTTDHQVLTQASDSCSYALQIYNKRDVDCETGSCWTTLFPNTPCGTQFKSPSQPQNMRGLRISFDLMCKLAGVQYEVMDGQGLILYGKRSILYPVHRTEDSVQWHFQSFDPRIQTHPTPEGERLLLSDLQELCNIETHYLGLWLNADIILGTDKDDLTTVTRSQAKGVPSTTTMEYHTVGGVHSHPKPLDVRHSSKVMKSRRNIYMVNFKGNSILSFTQPVILYSVQEKRAWMVPYINVLLHIAQARARHEKVNNFELKGCHTWGNGKVALKHLFDNHKKPVTQVTDGEKLDNEEEFLVQHYIEDISMAMDIARRETHKTRTWLNQPQSIIGFELADIIEKRDMVMKTHTLDPDTVKGSWLSFLEEINLVFFCENLPDILLPNKSTDFTSPCGKTTWRTIPKGFNLLAASLPCLSYLAEPHGNENLDALTRTHYWSCPNRTSARCKRVDQHTCFRVQELSTKDGNGPKILHIYAKEDGVAVFRHKDKADVIKAKMDEHRASVHSGSGSGPGSGFGSGYISDNDDDDDSGGVADSEGRVFKTKFPGESVDELLLLPSRPHRHLSTTTAGNEHERSASVSKRLGIRQKLKIW